MGTYLLTAHGFSKVKKFILLLIYDSKNHLKLRCEQNLQYPLLWSCLGENAHWVNKLFKKFRSFSHQLTKPVIGKDVLEPQQFICKHRTTHASFSSAVNDAFLLAQCSNNGVWLSWKCSVDTNTTISMVRADLMLTLILLTLSLEKMLHSRSLPVKCNRNFSCILQGQ